ncbi:MAG: GIY-YIG nuclease family protein, partial [Bdellovibrionota bacterium]
GLPKEPGVYVMLGLQGCVLYVGKAKSLRNRLNSYRLAHPDRVSRKVIRLLHVVEEIRFEVCATEKKALLRENQLLREHRPPFNVLNVSPESYYFFALRFSEEGIAFRLTTDPDREEGEEFFGAYKGRGTARMAYSALLRLIWALDASLERFEVPSLLTRYKPPARYLLRTSRGGELKRDLRMFLNGTSRALLPRLTERLLENSKIPPFYYKMIQEDLELLEEFFAYGPHRNRGLRRENGLSRKLIEQAQLDDLLAIRGL